MGLLFIVYFGVLFSGMVWLHRKINIFGNYQKKIKIIINSFSIEKLQCVTQKKKKMHRLVARHSLLTDGSRGYQEMMTSELG